MSDYDYEKLLDQARDSLPKNLFEGSRFEMPKIKTITVGNKTIIKNFRELIGIFRRDENHFMKFLLGEMATSGNIEGSQAVFQGKFSQNFIQDKVQKYADNYVLCPECDKPDTKIIKEGRIYFLRCEACGAKHPIKNI
ncbi:MAG TPA: translation initiation factor IF-2 subunit beta [Candidatus Methanofastidiosa archaeon]|nr:translation initiation factor IF-2 subunit beta [Candidatus Methanofastidiosa archaeon]HPR40945.1 translation initiation factor IF-2 subunit beta [Candidatus Methanofastidiosa archaeon]